LRISAAGGSRRGRRAGTWTLARRPGPRARRLPGQRVVPLCLTWTRTRPAPRRKDASERADGRQLR